MMVSFSPPKIVIVGLGLIIPDHVTPQAQKILSTCTKIYTIIQEPTILWLPSNPKANRTVVNLLHLYKEGIPRTENYDAAAKIILESCSPRDIVGYVTYGNPAAYDSVAQTLLRAAPQKKIAVELVPGISSLDTILCDLQIDMAPALQVYEASWMLVTKIEPRPGIQVILLQMGSFGSFRTHYSKRRDGSSLADLVSYLVKFYPPTHPVTLVRSTCNIAQPARTRILPLQHLEQATAEDLSGASLWIPAIHTPEAEPALVSRMEEV